MIANKLFISYALPLFIVLSSCNKDFLDKKPSTSLVIPSTLAELVALLDNTTDCNATSALGNLSSDEYYFLNYDSYLSEASITTRNAYLWMKDLYGGETNIPDWNIPYRGIFIANSVLDALSKITPTNFNESQSWNHVKGWALFIRAYLHYDLVSNFSPAYDHLTASIDLGIPIKLTANIDEIVQRSSVKETYDRIINDLEESAYLMNATLPINNRNRPWKAAAYGMLSRVYLSMREYDKAELYADSCLGMYSKLIDYNGISPTSSTPFTNINDESIFSSHQVFTYLVTASTTSVKSVSIDTTLLSLYDSTDLRLDLYYSKNASNYTRKRGYYGSGLYPYSGLATDEIYLIKAECLARRNEYDLSIDVLNTLLQKRYKDGTFVPLIASTAEDALEKVLQERRKELVFRGLRWVDLKRLNKEGANITLKRVLNDETYLLPPNDPRYVFPIPDDEIALSGISQNIR